MPTASRRAAIRAKAQKMAQAAPVDLSVAQWRKAYGLPVGPPPQVVREAALELLAAYGITHIERLLQQPKLDTETMFGCVDRLTKMAVMGLRGELREEDLPGLPPMFEIPVLAQPGARLQLASAAELVSPFQSFDVHPVPSPEDHTRTLDATSSATPAEPVGPVVGGERDHLGRITEGPEGPD